MDKLPFMCCLLAVLFGCNTKGTYEQTSRELTGLELIAPHLGYFKSWVPLGSDGVYQMTDEQQVEQVNVLNLCLNQLKSSSEALPSHALRSVLVVQCMEKQGWQLVVEELYIT
ncbi:hypothetical protein HRJ35_12075 [Shewanella oneidensis MR-1]|uniref:Predicted lipoprotein n=1 Tax=Shewanella oneidensis (strain ATCC 700550 / JCM 31522 / CIP 106686 / LMG 19005 / NCIMB 14063 / MR-1) TaxID=211586 RepID=Q8EFC2_SHEON|nr:hypothetical protein [Shewanella oneidensis]AAN55108.1 predicted lipoprotein [Shewanella oneidensis MR-1]MDX5996199.1 hypothetical protein [Shewanella oneidensis]MEE2029909.1 hypothetical protein [Shewanella oneidensis]QKG96677.1 hypothetical protein HRJ35_12075 [Shewanella oneidensis MR-1]